MTPERKTELLYKAAQCWCDPRTSHLVMETALAEVVHEALIEVEREAWAQVAKDYITQYHHFTNVPDAFVDYCKEQAEAAR